MTIRPREMSQMSKHQVIKHPTCHYGPSDDTSTEQTSTFRNFIVSNRNETKIVGKTRILRSASRIYKTEDVSNL